MVSSDPEWLLWREQYKIHSRSVSHQLSALTQAISQIDDVSTKVADLTTMAEQLQTQDNAEQQRVVNLETDANQQRRFYERIQADNDKLKERIVHLVQDANQQDQINAMNSQADSELETKLEKLRGDFINVIEAVETMQATTKVEGDKQKKEYMEIKAQMEAFLSSTVQEYLPLTGREQRDLASLFPIGNLKTSFTIITTH